MNKWELFEKVGKDESPWTGFLEEGVRLVGRLEVPGIFRIDGYVKGLITSTTRLILGGRATVEGTIEAETVVIAGRFEGILKASTRVDIQAGGCVRGEIHSPCVMIEPSGIFEGDCFTGAGNGGGKPTKFTVRTARPD
jgi:cytoskeletal protein CcmA (bactofilin family)